MQRKWVFNLQQLSLSSCMTFMFIITRVCDRCSVFPCMLLDGDGKPKSWPDKNAHSFLKSYCQVFYVENKFKVIRKKKKFVIDYKSLNLFLKNDKFSLFKIQLLFVQLYKVKILFKFDLKVGF